jgi:hypothetical protein
MSSINWPLELRVTALRAMASVVWRMHICHVNADAPNVLLAMFVVLVTGAGILCSVASLVFARLPASIGSARGWSPPL